MSFYPVVQFLTNAGGSPMNAREHAETMALQAFSWLCDDPALRDGFLAETGMSPADMARSLRAPTFLAAVMDFLLADDARVLAFCAAQDLRPEEPMRARALLPGGDLPHWT
jgi:hypothetical protein